MVIVCLHVIIIMLQTLHFTDGSFGQLTLVSVCLYFALLSGIDFFLVIDVGLLIDH